MEPKENFPKKDNRNRVNQNEVDNLSKGTYLHRNVVLEKILHKPKSQPKSIQFKKDNNFQITTEYFFPFIKINS